MADNTIDSLQLKISADAQSAEKSIARLADSLLRLQSSLKGITGGQFQNLSSGITELSNSMQQFSGSVKTADFTRIATGLNKLSSVNVQGVSDASRAINTLTANLRQIGSITFDSQGIANVANAIAQLGRKTVTQATANIPALTTALSSLINGLNQIGTVKFDITGLSELTSSISKLGGKSATTAASGNITKLATALKQMMTTLSSAPQVSQNLIQMTQALAQLASTGSRAGTATNTLIKSFNTLPSSTAKAKSGFSGLASAFGKFYATYWLFIRGMSQFKKAIDISSDLTEVQNVVDVAFGDMSDKMNEFADSALELYGMSELTAKQIGSRFQAMGVSMGFAQKDMTDMSIRLTQLAGDLASFYNITQDEAATKLQSIFTGESEPLRSLGIDLAQTSVEAWALSQGIDADMRSMTNAEKTMLRYQYVLASTGQATGDFQRTSQSWANQLRLLTGAFEQLGSIVGGVLINAFKPFIQALNSVMGAVISFAETVSNALGVIFGWEYQTGGGVAQDLEYGAVAAEDIEDATGGAAKNAKELNKYIAAWHEVNNMTTNDGTSGTGGGGGGGAGGTGGSGSGGQWVQSESLWEKYTSDIDSLYELGEYIGKVLTDAMNSIDWDSVYQGARNFGTGLANFLNGLISPDLFGAVGRTIAGALNTAIYVALSFGETFDWDDLGLSIATGINEFFKTFDFGSLAATINVWANGILDTIINSLDNIEWELIGQQIGTFFEEIDFLKILGKVGQAIWKALNSAFDAYKGMFETAPLETALLTLVSIPKLLKTDRIKRFISVLGSGIKTIEKFSSALSSGLTPLGALATIFPKLSGAVNVLTTSFLWLKNGIQNGRIFDGISSAIANIRNNLTGMQKGVISAASAFAEFNLVKGSISDLITGTGDLATNLIELASGAAIGAAGLYVALGPAGLAIAAIVGVIAAIMGINEAFQKIDAEKAGKDIREALEVPGGISIEELESNYVEMFDNIGSGFEKVSEKSQELDTANDNIQSTWQEIEKIELSMDSGVTSVEEGTAKLIELFGTLSSAAEEKFSSLENTLMAAFGENGAIRSATDNLGIDTESTMKTILQVNDDALTRIEEITQELSTLDPTNPKYYELKQELAELMGTTDQLSQSISDYELKIESTQIDYSGLLDSQNNLDSAKLTSFLDTTTNAITEANENIEKGVADIKTSLTEELNTALSLGDMESAEEIRAQLDALPQAITMLQSDVSVRGQEAATSLQVHFLQRIDDEINAAGVRWENMSAWEKAFSGFKSKDEYVYNAINDFKSNYIDPVSSEIETAYAEIGIDGAGFADETAGQIISSLFTQTVTYAQDGMPIVTTSLNDSYKTILQDSLAPLVEQVDPDIRAVSEGAANSLIGYADDQKDKIQTAFSGYANYAEQGFRDEAEKIYTNSLPPIMRQWAEQGIMNPFSSELGINSPSTVFRGYAKDTVEGFNQGIEGNSGSTKGVIGTWVSKITSWFTNALDINSPSGIFEKYARYTVEGFNEGLEENTSSSYRIVSKWADGISNAFGWKMPTIDLSVDTEKYKYTPPSIDTARLQTEMQESLSYMFGANGFIDYNRLGDAVYQAQSQALQENPVQIGDDDIFKATQRGQRRSYRRTGRIGFAGI